MQDYTLLPWEFPLKSSYAMVAAIALLLVYLIISGIISRRSISIRRGQIAIVNAYTVTIIANTLLYLLLYWYWALPLSLILTLLFLKITRDEIKMGHIDELNGMWGLNREMRIIRGEQFSDMTIEQQAEYKQKIVLPKFNVWIFLLVAMLAPVVITALVNLLGGHYLFFPIPTDYSRLSQ